jgi:hypothetical protein
MDRLLKDTLFRLSEWSNSKAARTSNMSAMVTVNNKKQFLALLTGLQPIE